jgi:hypothetical protein
MSTSSLGLTNHLFEQMNPYAIRTLGRELAGGPFGQFGISTRSMKYSVVGVPARCPFCSAGPCRLRYLAA